MSHVVSLPLSFSISCPSKVAGACVGTKDTHSGSCKEQNTFPSQLGPHHALHSPKKPGAQCSHET